MRTALVVGATGQLGTAAVRQLLSRGDCVVRAMVRTSEAKAQLESEGAQAVIADLTMPSTLAEACRGATHIVATANAAIPTRSTDTFRSVDLDGYRNLIGAAVAARVQRFVYTSAPLTRFESEFSRAKRATESLLQASGLDYVVFRTDVFMDVAFSMMGSAIPVRGATNATVMRPYAFARNHFRRVRDSIENGRKAAIPGDGSVRHAFICVDDVASFLVAALHTGSPGIYVLGGPESLGFNEIVRIYEQLLAHNLRVVRTPAMVFRALSLLFRPFSPAAANLMSLNYLAATEETFPDPDTWREFGVNPRSARKFLSERMQLAQAQTA